MSRQQSRRRDRGRGRVVMLVDNKVEGDSRVQKQARSAAERGWDVVLLGRSPDRQTHRWRIGGARVRLIPVPMPLKKPPHELRGRSLRAPLAYSSSRQAQQAEQRARGRRADARVIRAASEATAPLGRAPQPGRPRVLAHRALAKANDALVRLRVSQTDALAERRERMDAPLDRFTTWFWHTTLGDRSWRRLDPNLWDWELAFGPVIDDLAPDLIHANDARMLGVGARAKVRAAAAGRQVKLVWDAHEFLPGRQVPDVHPRWHAAQVAHEAEYAPYADAVTTTSEMMLDLLQRQHRLPVPPRIVRNAPAYGLDDSPTDGPDIRTLCGLSEDVPLLIYIGVVAPQRGVGTMIEALPRLPEVHMALLAKPGKNLDALTALADRLEIRDRLHVHPYVPVDRIVSHIATADVGVFPALHNLSHDSDLPTKFYEYAQARLPMVVSDVRTTAETTQMLGQGEVFRAGDVADYVRAVRTVLADLDRYRKAYDARPDLLAEWLWERQAEVLDAVYSETLGETSRAGRARSSSS